MRDGRDANWEQSPRRWFLYPPMTRGDMESPT